MCEFPDAGYDCEGNCLADADGDGVCDEFEVAGCTDKQHATTTLRQPTTTARACNSMSAACAAVMASQKARLRRQRTRSRIRLRRQLPQ